jgi:hypothetical protein
MSQWTCAACGTHNEPWSQTCMVCFGRERAAPEPPPRSARLATAVTAVDPHRPAPAVSPRRPPPAVSPRRPGTTTPPPAPARRARGIPGLLVLVLLAALIGGALLLESVLTGESETTSPSPGTTTADPPADPTTGATAGPAGLVAIDDPGPLAEEVAVMFETYFGGINDGDPDLALSVVEPSDRIDPDKPQSVARFARDISTTTDDEIRLGTVTDHGSTVTAELTFRSRQDPGFGPVGSPDQTCTRWTMEYTLANGAGGLLIRDVDAEHAGC